MKDLTSIRYERTSTLHDMFVPVRALKEAAPEVATGRSFSFAPLLFLLLAPLSLSLAGVGGTALFLSDAEKSTGNTFAAGPLDFTLSAEGLLAGTVGDGEAFGFSVTPVITPASNMLPFSYEVGAVIGGDEEFCEALQAAGFAPPLSYTGPASAFSAGPTDDLTPWELSFFVAEGTSLTEGASCMVDITYAGYQEGSTPGVMYHDVETLSLLLTYAPAPAIAPVFIELQSLGAPEVLGEEAPPQEETPAELPPETPEESTGEDGPEEESVEEEALQETEESQEPVPEEVVEEEEKVEEPPAETEEVEETAQEFEVNTEE